MAKPLSPKSSQTSQRITPRRARHDPAGRPAGPSLISRNAAACFRSQSHDGPHRRARACGLRAQEVGATIAHLIERFGAAPQGGIREAAVLSTCNRTELYCAVEDAQAARSSVLSYIANQKGVPPPELEPHIYTLSRKRPPPHLPRRLGSDSMVLGETQIVGQMKKAESWRASTTASA